MHTTEYKNDQLSLRLPLVICVTIPENICEYFSLRQSVSVCVRNASVCVCVRQVVREKGKGAGGKEGEIFM